MTENNDPPMFESEAEAVDWMQSRMFRNFDEFRIHSDRFHYGDTIVLEHLIYAGIRHTCHAPTMREALSWARQALHAWAPDRVAPKRDYADDWPYPKVPGATRGPPGVQLPDPCAAEDTDSRKQEGT